MAKIWLAYGRKCAAPVFAFPKTAREDLLCRVGGGPPLLRQSTGDCDCHGDRLMWCGKCLDRHRQRPPTRDEDESGFVDDVDVSTVIGAGVPVVSVRAGAV